MFFVGGGVGRVKGKVRTGSEVERSSTKGRYPGILGRWVNNIEVNSSAVLSEYLRLKRGGDVEALPVEGTQGEVGSPV